MITTTLLLLPVALGVSAGVGAPDNRDDWRPLRTTIALNQATQTVDPLKLDLPGGESSIKIVKKLLAEGYRFVSSREVESKGNEWTELYWSHPNVAALLEVDLQPEPDDRSDLAMLSCIALMDLSEPLDEAKKREAALNAIGEKTDFSFEFSFRQGSDPKHTVCSVSTSEEFDIFGADSEDQGENVSERFQALRKVIEPLKKLAKPVKAPETEAGPSDPVGRALKASHVTYDESKDFYNAKFSIGDSKRYQVTYIRKAVFSYNSIDAQECFSQIYESKDRPSAELLLTLSQRTFTIGGLILEPPSDGITYWRIRFRCEIPTDSSPERVTSYLEMVASTADALELEFSKEDKL